LDPEVVLAGEAVMNAHSDSQQDRMLEIDVDRHPLGGAVPERRLLTAITGSNRRNKGHFAYLTGGLVDRRHNAMSPF
jgi:hypothetical protein